jgi:hypothetical protein
MINLRNLSPRSSHDRVSKTLTEPLACGLSIGEQRDQTWKAIIRKMVQSSMRAPVAIDH